MKLRITVDGKDYEVEVEVLDDPSGILKGQAAPGAPAPAAAPRAAAPPPSAAPARAARPAAAGATGKSFTSPLTGTVRAIKVAVGDTVEANQELFVIEAMKMETSVAAKGPGKVAAILTKVGDAVKTGTPLLEFE